MTIDEEILDMIEATYLCDECKNKVNCDECWLDWLHSEAE